MDGLIPFVLKALKKKKTMRHYRSLTSNSHLEDVDVTEPSPQGLFFMTQHPRAPRWHGGGENIFMTPQHHTAAWRLGEGDCNREPPPAAAVPAAMVPTAVRTTSGNMQRRLSIVETPPPPLIGR